MDIDFIFRGFLVAFTSIGAILALAAVVSLVRAPNRFNK